MLPLPEAFKKLERLKELLDEYNPIKYQSSERTTALHREIPQLYGEVAEVYKKFADSRPVQVVDGKHTDTFPNYFEAGYLSGRTFHANQGYNELLKVLGRVRNEASQTGPVRESPRIKDVSTILGRFRQCCQYLAKPPENERDVQDVVWIMLRSHFDRLDRDDTLKRFGVKKYVPDFGIPELKLLIEVKFIGEATKPNDIQEELLADVPGYLQDGGGYTQMLAFVYDAAHKLRDERKFIEDLLTIPGIGDVIVVPGIG